MNEELYEELLFLVASESDTSEATLSAFYDVAIDRGASITLQSCRHCKVLCDPECGACNCEYPLTQYEPEDDGHDLRPEERWCNQCATVFDEELHGPWCPHCHGLPIEDAPESPTQVVPNEEPQQFPMTEDDDIPF